MAAILPLVLVPGLLCSARLYAPQIAALWPFGQLPLPITDATARWLRLRRAFLPTRRRVSRSLGCRWAAISHSQCCGRRRSASPNLHYLTLRRGRIPPNNPRRAKNLSAWRKPASSDDVVETLTPRFLHRNRHNDEVLKRVVREMAADTGPEAFVRQQKAIMSRPDSRPLLATIRCPTLVLVGDGDELTPPELAKEICAGISGARLVVVPDCGHLSTIEKPDVSECGAARNGLALERGPATRVSVGVMSMKESRQCRRDRAAAASGVWRRSSLALSSIGCCRPMC